MRSFSRVHIFSFVAFLWLSFAFAQKTTIYIEADCEFKTGVELFDKKKFGAAMKSFDNIIASNRNQKDLTRIDAEYYSAASSIELFNKDGEWKMRKFIERNPESNKVKWAYFYLGKSNFRKKKYKETIEYLEQVDIYDLSKEDLAELYFKRGYSYLQEGKTEKAKNDLYEIKDVDNKYAHPANYYYSHIAYTEKNYATALEGFTRLQNDETFGSVVPYYIAQVYYLQGKYEDVIRVAPALLNDSTHAQKAGEINRIIGESYYHTQQYADAIPYLLKGGSGTASDNYEVGYAYYKTNDFKEAINYFEKSASAQDSLAQNAFYYMAECYLKLGDKAKARNAYYSAEVLPFDKRIKEESLFNYAKLCYETGFSPYNDAIKYFMMYILQYPNSPNKEEAYNYLLNCFHSTKNYAAAMKIIEKMNSEDPRVKQVYQKLAYFQGVNYYNNNQPDSAKKFFNLTFKLNTDQALTAESKYWLAELSYQNKAYNNAIESWQSFQLMPGAYGLMEYQTSNYNIGYAYFMNKNYDEAGIYFRKYLLNKNLSDALKAADANLRTADCYFMDKNYSAAAEYYETAIALNKIDVDYAMYQKALCDGLQKNYKEKVNDLNALQQKFPSSNYIAASVYETAESYKAINEYDNAIEYYEKVIEKFPASPYVGRSIKTIGFLYYNQNKYDKAFAYLDRIVKQNPKSDEAKDAIETIKKIYKEQHKPEEMEAYLASIGTSASAEELDESYWQKASDFYYEQKNCELAMPEMKKYIEKFPNGKYINDANFDYAECAYSKGDFDNALTAYRYVLSKPRGIHSEISLVKASYILFKNKDYAAALPLFTQLQDIAESAQNKLAAKLGAMRSAYYTKNYELCVDECNKVMNTEKISPAQLTETHQLKARSLYELNRRDESAVDFNYLAKNAKSEAGAEALYYLALIRFQKKEIKETEKEINALIAYDYSTNDWNTKGILLMADVYIEKGDAKNAEAFLQNVIENSDKPEYVDIARQKLQELRDKQAAKEAQKKQEEQMRIQFENPGKDILFNEQPIVPANDSTQLKTTQPK